MNEMRGVAGKKKQRQFVLLREITNMLMQKFNRKRMEDARMRKENHRQVLKRIRA